MDTYTHTHDSFTLAGRRGSKDIYIYIHMYTYKPINVHTHDLFTFAGGGGGEETRHGARRGGLLRRSNAPCHNVMIAVYIGLVIYIDRALY